MRLALAAAAAAALLAAVTALAERTAPEPLPPSEAAEVSKAPLESPCPPRTLPDHGVCIPVPGGSEQAKGPDFAATRDPILPRSPERPREYAAYLWPIALGEGPDAVRSPAPPLTASVRESQLTGVALRANRSEPVSAPRLENQQGDTIVMFSGELVGPTVVTRHRVQLKGEVREYLLFYGNLERAPALTPTTKLAPEKVLGTIGDSASPGDPQLYFDARQLRPGFDPVAAPVGAWLDTAHTIPVDPRNLLPRS